jgi:hypothetical protein
MINHAFVVPLEPEVLVEGIDVTLDSLERKWGWQSPPAKEVLRVVSFTVMALDVTTPTPPTSVQGPPETGEVEGCASAAACENVSPEPPPPPGELDPFAWNGPECVAYKPPKTAATTTTTTTAITIPIFIMGLGVGAGPAPPGGVNVDEVADGGIDASGVATTRASRPRIGP